MVPMSRVTRLLPNSLLLSDILTKYVLDDLNYQFIYHVTAVFLQKLIFFNIGTFAQGQKN